MLGYSSPGNVVQARVWLDTLCLYTLCLFHAGVPDSASVQEVIFWQGRTIQMMYHIIGQAMQRNHITDAHPKDYLAFFCLGQWSPLLASPPALKHFMPALFCSHCRLCSAVSLMVTP